MKKLKIYSLLTCLICLPSIWSCEKSFTSFSKNSNSDMSVETRSDPRCDMCSLIACCCYVELNQAASIDLHICGVSGSYPPGVAESCSMHTGDGCYNVNNQGIHYTISSNKPRLYFCLGSNASFSLYNATGSGHGNVKVACSDTGSPSGGMLVDLDYNVGAQALYFATNDCVVDEPCDY